jgi:hypothetical protein
VNELLTGVKIILVRVCERDGENDGFVGGGCASRRRCRGGG